MEEFAQALSDKLGEIYRNVTRLEEHALQAAKIDLTISEVHLVSFLSKLEDGITLSGIARQMGVSRPTVTVAVSKLVAKGYVRKSSGEKDGRQVKVHLTEEGRKVIVQHRRCQRNVIFNLGREFSAQERSILLRAVEKLNRYFQAPKPEEECVHEPE